MNVSIAKHLQRLPYVEAHLCCWDAHCGMNVSVEWVFLNEDSCFRLQKSGEEPVTLRRIVAADSASSLTVTDVLHRA